MSKNVIEWLGNVNPELYKGENNMNYDNQSRSNGALYESVMGNPTAGAGSTMDQATQTGTVSRRAYNFIIGLVILWGVGIDTLICVFFKDALVKTFNNNWVTILIYLALVISGIIVVHVAKNPVLSFLGYNLMVVGFGITLAMVVEHYAPAVVTEAFLVTTVVTALMLLLGTLWQDMFKKIGRILCVALIGVIITEVIMLIFTGTYPTWISVVSAIIFSGFIGYDWAKAQEAPSTVKNAVMFATSLYVDIVNLFLDILRITGDS